MNFIFDFVCTTIFSTFNLSIYQAMELGFRVLYKANREMDLTKFLKVPQSLQLARPL